MIQTDSVQKGAPTNNKYNFCFFLFVNFSYRLQNVKNALKSTTSGLYSPKKKNKESAKKDTKHKSRFLSENATPKHFGRSE